MNLAEPAAYGKCKAWKLIWAGMPYFERGCYSMDDNCELNRPWKAFLHENAFGVCFSINSVKKRVDA